MRVFFGWHRGLVAGRIRQSIEVRACRPKLDRAGHADGAGTAPYNQERSVRRAQAVADYLVAGHGIDSSRLTVKGSGETRPIVSHGDETGRALNRRIEYLRAE